MSVAVTYAATCTVAETLANNTGSAPAGTRLVTHTEYNETATLNSGTTPPATICAHFLLTLSSGAATVNLAALTGTNGATTDLTGLKVQVLRVKNLGANNMVIVPGASNGIDLLGASSSITIYPGAHAMFYLNDSAPDVASGDRTLDVTGTGSQTSEWTIVAG